MGSTFRHRATNYSCARFLRRQTAVYVKTTKRATRSGKAVARSHYNDLSEGVIRIVNLLNALPISTPPDFKAQYPNTHALFTEVSGFAILEARQQLPKNERRKQDIAREQIETLIATK